jgi:hypothetical protein
MVEADVVSRATNGARMEKERRKREVKVRRVRALVCNH